MKTAFIFSGQGAQYSGMGKELYDAFPECREVFDKAAAILDFPLKEICFNENEKDNLNKTEYCQAAIFTVCAAVLKLLEKDGVKADMAAGLSLGEYTALAYSGAFEFADTVRLLRYRGLYMAEAAEKAGGIMSAILGLSPELAEKACAEASSGGIYAVPSNFNAPGQIVISGAAAAVEKAEALCLSYGAKRAMRLAVSGPYHTDYMRPAANKLHDRLLEININDMRIPVVSNVDAEIIPYKEAVLPTLLKQLTGPVRWEACVNKMVDEGVDTFVEIGPGRTLSSFVKKINAEVKSLNIENLQSYEKTVKELA